MSSCSIDLRKRGYAAPLTCPRCGRGPCRNTDSGTRRTSDSLLDMAVGAVIGSALSSVFDSAPDTTVSDFGTSSDSGTFID